MKSVTMHFFSSLILSPPYAKTSFPAPYSHTPFSLYSSFNIIKKVRDTATQYILLILLITFTSSERNRFV